MVKLLLRGVRSGIAILPSANPLLGANVVKRSNNGKRVPKTRVQDPRVILLQVREGLKARIASRGPDHSEARAIVPAHPTSIFNAYRSIAAGEIDPTQRTKIRLEAVIISAALSSTSVPQQRSFLLSLASPDSSSFIAWYALGPFANSPPPSLATALSYPCEDLSIIVECLRDAGIEVSPAVDSAIDAEISSFRGELFRDSIHDISNPFVLPFSKPPMGSAIATLVAEVGRAKRLGLHIYGPGLLTGLLLLSDPASQMSPRQLLVLRTLATDANLLLLFTALVAARVLGPFRTFKDHLWAFAADPEAPTLPYPQRKHLEDIIGFKSHNISIKPRGPCYLKELLYWSYVIKRSIATHDRAMLVDAIIGLYGVDPDLPKFLDWTSIRNHLEGHKPPTAKTAFITMLMNDEVIRSCHPDIVLVVGKGTFTGDFTKLLGTTARGAIGHLLAKIGKLPKPAAAALTTAFLDQSIMERVASNIPHRRRQKGNLHLAVNAHHSMVRIDALRAALSRRLISSEYAVQQLAQETDRIRLQYFQGRFRSGRVLVDWNGLETSIDIMTRSELPIVASLSANGWNREIHPDIIPKLSNFIADRIVDVVLRRSEASVDIAISNNLRHGVILPRFLRAFDDAYHTQFPRRALSSWNSPAMSKSFPDDGQTIVELREDVSNIVKAYIFSHLTISRDGNLDLLLQKFVAKEIALHLSRRSRSHVVYVSSVVADVAKREVFKFLKTASQHLHSVVRKEVMETLSAARRQIAHPRALEYLDSLDGNLDHAFDEARQWVGLAELGGAENFKFSDIVKLVLISTQLSSADKLKVESSSLIKVKSSYAESDFSINGKYFACVQEVVHNLLSNAFTNSGNGKRTDIMIDLVVLENHILFRCANGMSEEAFLEAAQKFRATVALANAHQGLQAGRDQLSGFQKIRLAISAAFGTRARINIPPLSAKRRRFLVEVRVDRREDFMVP